MNSTRRFPALFVVSACVLCMSAVSARAQTQAAAQATPKPTTAISFKDGKSVAANFFSRSGDNLYATVPVGDAWGQVGYPVNTVAKINFPEPAQLQTATELLLRGSDGPAITQLDPIITYYDTYKDISGSWWAAAMRLKLKAFLDLRRDGPADALIDAMVKVAPADSEDARIASVLKAASMARKGDNDKALAIYEDVIKNSTNEGTLAYAWLNKGNSLYALQKYDPALLAYLHVPVFYSDEKLLLPAVLLGAGKCYAHLENLPEAQNSYNDLIQQFPSSPEAAAAKVELKKIEKLIPAATATPTPAPDNSTPAASPAAATPAPAADSNSTPATPASAPASTPAK